MAVKELKVFDQKLYHILSAITETMVPPDKGFSVAPHVVDTALLVDNYIEHIGNVETKLIKTIIYVIEYAPMITRLKRFTRMSQEERLVYLEGWEHSRLLTKRNLFMLLKMLVMMQYYSDDRVTHAINYTPECLLKD